LCKAEVTVCCKTVPNAYTQCEHHAEFLNVKPGGS